MKVLYVEDEKYLADAVIYLLKKSSIAVDWVDNGEEAVDLAVRGEYDCMVLDIMLPKMSGWDVLYTLRKRNIAAPIIMLSALAEVDDKVKALDSGADDYLVKPFKTTELIARIRALTRRPPVIVAKELTYGDLTYDLNKRTLNQLVLTAKESALIELFLRQPEHLHSKERILLRVWGNDPNTSESYVEVYMSYLRRKLKLLRSKVKIMTVRGLGYKLTIQE